MNNIPSQRIIIGDSEDDKAVIRALQNISLPRPAQENVDQQSLEYTRSEFNSTLREIRIILPVITPLIEKIPRGAIIVAALGILMDIADSAITADPNSSLQVNTASVTKANRASGNSYIWIGESEEDQQAIRNLESISVPDDVYLTLKLSNLRLRCKDYHKISFTLKELIFHMRPLIIKLPNGNVIVSGVMTLISFADVACFKV